jgi:hypothetical protein
MTTEQEVQQLRAHQEQLLDALRGLMNLAQNSKGPEWQAALQRAAKLVEKLTRR